METLLRWVFMPFLIFFFLISSIKTPICFSSISHIQAQTLTEIFLSFSIRFCIRPLLSHGFEVFSCNFSMFLLFFPDLSLSVPGKLFLFPFEAALFLSLERGLPSERHLFAALQFENPTALSKDLGISLIAAKEGNFLEAERIFLGGPESAGNFFQCTERRGRGGGGRRESVTRVSLNSGGSTRLRTRSNLFLVVCKCFSILTSSTVVLCIAVNVLSAIRSFKDGYDVFDGIFRCYEVLIAAFVVLAETEWELIKFLKCTCPRINGYIRLSWQVM
ncbi:uncharacterized protein LOC107435404 isoform X2 [Ziziphus jujuba]|uniref:Uncharacterized protein LOC107435404 isoform X2 n=1 Tax=Ziziphus jujuba TaxID=326968 RepID=A0ABM4AAA5_ZIZJJ|nr:uncharacterized protein LOC107435404 isoform X2 [Ziziphus jujuba]